jgi:hypothetical protein
MCLLSTRDVRRLKLLVSLVGGGLFVAAGGGVLAGCGVADATFTAGAGTTVMVSTAASPSSPAPTVQSPAWLLERMQGEARSLGDPGASAWWTLTTAEKAVIAEDDWPSGQPVANPDRAVYVMLLNGAFTNWIWSYPASASDPDGAPRPGPWVVELIDAKSHLVDVEGNTAKRPDTSHLTLNAWELTDPAAQDVPAWLLEKAMQEAEYCGDPHPERAEWTVSHKLEAVRVLSGDEMFDTDPEVVVLVLKGRFSDTHDTLSGMSYPTGTWLSVVFDLRTHEGLGFGLGDKPCQLEKLGPVHRFSF